MPLAPAGRDCGGPPASSTPTSRLAESRKASRGAGPVADVEAAGGASSDACHTGVARRSSGGSGPVTLDIPRLHDVAGVHGAHSLRSRGRQLGCWQCSRRRITSSEHLRRIILANGQRAITAVTRALAPTGASYRVSPGLWPGLAQTPTRRGRPAYRLAKDERPYAPILGGSDAGGAWGG